MIVEKQKNSVRKNFKIDYSTDLVITGGGLSGTCAAIAAARAGVKVILVQDRPVLGGNSSSEVRLWILGATSHMGNNNRWSREGGVVDEILVENLYRNKEGNAIIFDTILLEKVTSESNITLLLNTAVFEVTKKDENTIESIRAFCSQTSTEYILSAPLFIDSSGDGIVGFLSGSPFRMGAETKEEFGELFAPDKDYGEMLGHTIYFYSKDAGHPVKYVPPAFALKDIKQIPRYKTIDSKMNGCQFWWFEYGGRFEDTVKETENIKWELWKVVYGAWDYIKNSGNFPDAENLTLEWVGTIPGKRESRRFEGEYMLKQQDIIEQKEFYDAVAFGGWSLDLHPADGVYSDLPGCNQWHPKGIYQIPYRSLLSKTINNLFFAGRIISATHVAFASTRVMATSAHGAQAAACAAVICVKNGIDAKKILEQRYVSNLQNQLNLLGQSIPGKAIDYRFLEIERPVVKSSSTYELKEIAFNGDWVGLEEGFAQLLPLKASVKYKFKILVKALVESKIIIQLRKSSKLGNYTPDVELEKIEMSLAKGKQFLNFSFETILDSDQYAFLLFQPTKHVLVKTSEQRLSGTLSLFQKMNKAVSNYGKQEPPEGIGVDSFELWTPKRRPDGKNLAFTVSPSINLFDENNLTNGFVRPYLQTNAWAASLEDNSPELKLTWNKPQKIKKIRLFFDTDYDHPLESVLMGHPEDIIPFCIQNYSIYDKDENLLYKKTGNYQTINNVELETEIECTELILRLEHPSKDVPAALFEIICLNHKLN
ncbi:FAD-dependent oxidoreductase [Maribellus comscasis]|uniref:FAD-dependent oxidoreductase n=1 Tax=Maribellus comscasis TaxID=2681766 RepID=A0A6I6JYB0_9BACT|nr:FAD-dependent oxidoreductase [Maribellus comscasis]QGY47531.1 FAD-dependent oxidoreductase [Maribellus comscasis]